MQSQNLPTDVITQVRGWFAEDQDLIENGRWSETELFTGIKRHLDQEFPRDSEGPISVALEIVLRRLAVEQSATCPPSAATLHRTADRIRRLAEYQEATESLLPELSS